MGTLTVHFEGICTQIKVNQVLDGALHRVVMVKWETVDNINGFPIPPHNTYLCCDPASLAGANLRNVTSVTEMFEGNWRLQGTRLQLQSPALNAVTYDLSFYSVPSLTNLTPDLGRLSENVVYGSDAAALFDVAGGTFAASTMEAGAYYSILTLESTDDDPTLLVSDLGGTGSGTISFRDGTTIVVNNTGRNDLGEKPWDFLLHYLCAERMPLDARYPGENPKALEALGPGCSNSSYP